jgi:hypothetical protein
MFLPSLKTFFASLLFVVSLQSCNRSNDSASSLNDDHTHTPDTPAVHGMLLFGTEQVWLSHLPMFHKPHDYQVIMSVRLEKNGKDMLPTYLADRNQSQAVYYTFVPKRFSMTNLVGGTITSIEGSLVRGHFERGGVTIATGVTAFIKSMPVKVQFQVDGMKSEKASYYVLGDSTETWLAHKIVAKPDEFDHIIAAELPTDFWNLHTPGDVIETELDNLPHLRLEEGTNINATSPFGAVIEVKVGGEIYQETGDLH